MLNVANLVTTIEGIDADDIPEEVIRSTKPLVIKQLVGKWRLVEMAKLGDEKIATYLKSFYNGRPTVVCKTNPESDGRLFYNANLTRLDYESYKGRIDETLDAILKRGNQKNSPGYYIASNIVDTHLPGLREENQIRIPRVSGPHLGPEIVSIWIGSPTTASCHYDALDNIACCVAGRRRFTLFPPEQVGNLYPGPLDPTPGGQVISLVDFRDPDLDRFPRFSDALEHACIAELEPGDALFLPSMWWHHVEALEPLNILVNYWWNEAPRYMTSGMNALYLAMLGIRDKPKHEREGWRHLFNYYIFEGAKNANSKIPAEARGFLEELDETYARKLRALVINKLNR